MSNLNNSEVRGNMYSNDIYVNANAGIGGIIEYDVNENRANSAVAEATTKENKDFRIDGGVGDVCFICREKDMPISDPDCKTCQNILSYKSKQNVREKGDGDEADVNQNVTFPGPGIVMRNHIYGNYVVASRTIEEGELIILERPLTIGPYSMPDVLPLCLSCCKDIGLSSKCSKCKWPVCNTNCEQFYLHSENECEIFAKNEVRCKNELKEFFSVETLRALLIRDRDNYAWKRILEFEPHLETRLNDYRAKETSDFIVDFIRNKCNLADQFSTEIVEHVVGVLSVNTFWAYKDLQRYASCLFDKITLFAHDCDPNTNRRLIFLSNGHDTGTNDGEELSSRKISDIALQIKASRRIQEGEMITIRYINVDQPLQARRNELRETFYFDCTCSRCLHELSELKSNQIEAKFEELLL